MHLVKGGRNLKSFPSRHLNATVRIARCCAQMESDAYSCKAVMRFAGGANERNSAKRFLEIFAGLLIFDVIMVIIAVFLYEI